MKNNMNPLLQLIESQKSELHEHLKHTYQTGFDGLDLAMEKTDGLHTASIKAVLENLREYMERSLYPTDNIGMPRNSHEAVANHLLKMQIDLLTETINSLSEAVGTN